MSPDERELEDEIRGHLALEVHERIEQGEDPETARRSALGDFGYIPAARESMRRVWRSRWTDAGGMLLREMRIGFRSLRRAPGLTLTVVFTLALGIGANAAIFSVVRGVLLRPLVNRDEDRLIYIRQSAPGIGADNLTFSVPEVQDLQSRVTTVAAFGQFSTVEFTLVGLGGEPRAIRAGVVDGSFFDVMGLRPVLGRLLGPGDDGPKAAGAAVLTYRFWTTALNADPTVVGRTVRLGPRPATIVGVLEPSIPYPADTEIIANIVTSPHHLGATMVTNRTHRMTELFGRLAPGATIEEARSELSAVHAAMVAAHPEAYSTEGHAQVQAVRLRDQVSAPARPVLLLLLAAAGVVFVIACSNVASLILARSVRREGELAIRAALGAGRAALRRTLLAESLVLCGAGAVLGILLARPFVALVARYAARFSVRALDVSVDPSVVWIGAALALAAAALLAYIPRLPSAGAPAGLGLASGGLRLTPATSRRLRLFATTQIAFSFVLLAGAGTLVATLVALQTANPGYDTHHVIVFDIPMSSTASNVGDPRILQFYDEATRQIARLPGVDAVAIGSFAPWRDAGSFGPGFRFKVDGYTPAPGEDDPRARFRIVAPNFFAVLGVPIVAGRDFNDDDRAGQPLVAIVSQTLARRIFPNADAINRRFTWTNPITGGPVPTRIVGIVADLDDENIVPGAVAAIYFPVRQIGAGGRLFVHTAGDPYLLVPSVTSAVRRLAADQPVERGATLADVRAQVLSPERLKAFVFSGFAGVALLIAIVGVAGVLAFTVSARTREFGVRLAVGSSPRRLLLGVLREGVGIVAVGVAAGAVGAYGFAIAAGWAFGPLQLPGALPLTSAALVMALAAGVASLLPAARASRVDVLQALRSE